MPASPILASQITQEAAAQGVPPAIALAVAQQESGISQWTSSGNLVTGSAGEIGVFQLMPQTASNLGVDPTDVNQNISGGISLLAQLFNKYGNWAQALSAYNSGSPNGSPGYANSVLAIAGGIPTVATPSVSVVPDFSSFDLSSVFSSSDTSDTWWMVGIIAGGLFLWWVLD